jgi:ATP-dependent DNA helicase RecQ
VPLAGCYTIADPSVPPEAGAANSAHRIAAVARRFRLDGRPTGRVLLVDDLVGTGWTLTLAARDLRAAGADAVLPLTLGTTS